MSELAAASVPPEVAPGSIIAGRYRVESTLGHGGMGVVLAARHVTLGQRVAIKLMLPEALADADALSRFMREAWAASRISSEYVTRVFDMGELPSGAPYIVMEFLEGEDLSARLKHSGPLPVAEVTTFALQICEALAEAHAIGIVHRDLKPSNVFCVRRAGGLTTIKVLDFGISKLMMQDPLRADPSLTSTRSVIGSPSYMSPEQMRAPKTVDTRTDIWSLGVLLYEMLSGVLPFQAETLPELAVRLATEAPPPLASLRPALPAGLTALVERCLQRERERRDRDVGRLAQRLVPFAPPSAHVHAERAARLLRHAGAQALPPENAVERTDDATGVNARTRGRLWWPGALLLGLLVAATATAWLLRTPNQPAPHLVRPLPPPAAVAAVGGRSAAMPVEPSTDAPLPTTVVDVPRSTRIDAKPASTPASVTDADRPPGTPPTTGAPATGAQRRPPPSPSPPAQPSAAAPRRKAAPLPTPSTITSEPPVKRQELNLDELGGRL